MRFFQPPLILAAILLSVCVAQQPTEVKDSPAVYVRDGGIAMEKISLAERLERLGEWRKSADVYQEIVDKYADRLIPTGSNDQDRVVRYTSVALVVQEKLARWPKEGLAEYRRRYESVASELLNQAQSNPLILRKIFLEYFPTDAAKRAGLKLMSQGLENGQFASAVWVGQRLLAYHPSLSTDRPWTLFLTAISEHVSGNRSGARELLRELREKYPDSTGIVRGETVILSDTLEQKLSQEVSLVRTSRSDNWPMPFGNPQASAIPTQTSNGGARLFSVEIVPFDLNRKNLMRRQQLNRLSEQRRMGNLTGIIPVVDSGELFFQDNSRIYALNLSSGLPLTDWTRTYPAPPRGAYSVPTSAPPVGIPLGLTVTDQRVISVLGQVTSPWIIYDPVNRQNESRVVCLDRTSGQLLWSTTARKLKVPAEQESVSQGQFCGIPLVENGKVYVPVRTNRGGQFEETHLVALRLSDGSFLWSTYIASTAGGNAIIDAETGVPLSTFFPMLSFSDGRVYVLTNLGAIACLDANDGKTFWLNTYSRSSTSLPRNAAGNRLLVYRPSTSKPFTQDPPMIVDGKLFVAPSDSDEILICDAVSGEVIQRIPRNLESPRFEPVNMMLAVIGDQLILGNDSTIFSIPWRTFDPKKKLLDNGGKYRIFEHPTGNTKNEPIILGRPFVSADRIYVPISSKLYRMSIREWRIEDAYPSSGTWDPNEEAPGNVLATADHVIIASDSRVTVYTDLMVATAKIDQQIKQSPSDPEPYLKYAELLLAGGKPLQAIEWLDQAKHRIGQDKSGKPDKHDFRDRLFEISCGFAVKLQRSDHVTPELIRQLFLHARQAANTPQQQVRYRLAHASFLATLSDSASEVVALYQEILANAQWRSVVISRDDGDTLASVEAEKALTELVKKRPELYASYEQEARSKLDLSLKEPSTLPEVFIDLAEQYPLSTVAVPALQQASERFASTQRYGLSILSLRKVLKYVEDTPTRLQTLQVMAQRYLQMSGQTELAILRLEQALRIDPSAKLSFPLWLNDHERIEPMPLIDAIGVLKAYHAKYQASLLPRLDLPDGNTHPDKPPLLPVEEYNGVASLVTQQNKFSRPDRVVGYTPSGTVLQFPAGSIQPMSSGIKVNATPLGCGFYDDLLVIVTPTGVYAADGEKVRWSFSIHDLSMTRTLDRETSTVPDVRNEEANTDGIASPQVLVNGRAVIANRILRIPPGNGDSPDNPESESITHFRLLSDRVILRTSTGRIVCVDVSSGVVQWQIRSLEEPVIRHFTATDDFIVISSWDVGSYSEVRVIDTLNGMNILSLTFDPQQGGQQLMNLALSPDGVLVTTTLNELTAHNLHDPDHGSWKRELGNLRSGQAPFINMTASDYLQIVEGKIIALTVVGNRPQVVRIFDLYTGESRQMVDPRTRRKTDQVFNVEHVGIINAFPPVIMLKNDGGYLYVIGNQSFKAYQMEGKGSWAPEGLLQRGTVADLILAQDYAVLVQTPVNPQTTQTVPSFQLSAYSRKIVGRGEESGLLTHRATIKDPSQILVGQWQISNGSVYYISANRKLKMLRSNS